MLRWLLGALLVLDVAPVIAAQSQPLVQLEGQPYFGGSMKLSLSASGSTGLPALVIYGLGPLVTPVQTAKGDWYIEELVNLVAIGTIPAGGRIDLLFTMPPIVSAFVGIPIVAQAYVPVQLSNPVTLPLDIPYFTGSADDVFAAPVPVQQAQFGDRLAVSDVNGDGAADLVVTAPTAEFAGVTQAGIVYVFWGPQHNSPPQELTSPSPLPAGLFGTSILIADLDGDGEDDMVLGEGCGGNPPLAQPGHLYIYYGGTAFLPTPSVTLESVGAGAPFTQFGRSMAAGDFNGDANLDVAVGVDKATDGTLASAGRIDVYWGPGFSSVLPVWSPDAQANDFFGSKLAVGDINGDGIDDLLESSGREDVGQVVNQGRAHLFVGPALAPYVTLENPLPAGFNSRFGNDIASSDLNGDGRADVVISDSKSHAYVFWAPQFADYQVIHRPLDPYGGLLSGSFGYYLDIGDANGDGLDDIAITDEFAGDPGCTLTGGGLVFVALAPYFETFLTIGEIPNECGAEFGSSVSLADIDSDAKCDLLVGSVFADQGVVGNAGRVSVWLGSP